MADDFAYQTSIDAPARKWVKVTKGTPLDKTCRCLLVGVGGTANLVDDDGEASADVPLQQGYNFLRVAAVSTGGTADDIWALY